MMQNFDMTSPITKNELAPEHWRALYSTLVTFGVLAIVLYLFAGWFALLIVPIALWQIWKLQQDESFYEKEIPVFLPIAEARDGVIYRGTGGMFPVLKYAHGQMDCSVEYAHYLDKLGYKNTQYTIRITIQVPQGTSEDFVMKRSQDHQGRSFLAQGVAG